jgi:serine/threonine protein kinase
MIINRRYIREKAIGKGGYGDVWMAKDLKTLKRVALKVVSRSPFASLFVS